jgi:putative ABC transport system permease protein
MQSFLRLQAISTGFNPQSTLTMKISLQGPGYQKGEAIIAFYDQLLDKIRTLPGVRSAAIRSSLPLGLTENYADLSFAVEGQTPDPANRPVAFYNAVSPDHFRTMEIPLLQGRVFDERDNRKSRNVIIINETLARRHFPGEDPIGKRMTLNDDNPKEEDWATIVGVVRDTKPRRLTSNSVREMYVPFAQQPRRSMALLIRTSGDPEGVAAAARREAQRLDHDLPVHSVRTLESVTSEAVSSPRFRSYLLGVFAVLALALAMIGVYGVMSYAVTQRAQEFGLRMALGASGADVMKLVLGHGMSLALAGVGIGLAASLALTRVISQLLYGVKPNDPLTFAVIAASLLGVAALACLLPARRAMKADPMAALRCE